MAVEVTLTQVLIPKDFRETGICYIKLGASGGSASNKSIAIFVCDGDKFGKTHGRFHYNVDIPEGVNTVQLEFPWHSLRRYTAEGGGFFRIFDDCTRELCEYQIGETFDEQELTPLDEGDLPEYVWG